MKPNELLENAIGKIDDDLLFDAAQARIRKPRRIPYFVAAACLTVMLLAVPLGILLANQTETPEVPSITSNNAPITTVTPPTTTTPPQTTARPSVLDIPGATLYDENDKHLNLSGDNYSGTSSPSDEELLAWAENVKKKNKVVVGVIKNSTSVIVEEGEDLYRITCMDFTVLDDVSGLGQQTVKIAYACRYEFSGTNFYRPVTKYIADFSTDGNEKTRAIVNDMAYFTEKCIEESQLYGKALLLLTDAQDQSLSLSSGSLLFSDYADYVLDASFACSSSMNLVTSYSLSTPVTLRFKLEWLRSVIQNSLMLTPKKEGIYFTLENSFEIFGNHPALSVTVDNGCRFYNDIFIVTDTRPKLNQTYQWAINIEGKRYEINRVWHYNIPSNTTYHTPPSVTLYFDLGANFPWESLACNENREYTFLDVSLELYDKENNLICITNLIDLWKCNGYTHTLPETITPIDRFSQGIDILLGKKLSSQESSPDLVLIKPMNTAYFRLEDAYDGFDQRTALVFSVNREENCPFADLFLDCDNPQVNTDFVWEFIIDGITYEVEGFAFESTDTETLVYLVLGHSFDISGYPFDENRQYIFKDVKLGIYSLYDSQVYYHYFAKLGAYTHTKP